MRLSSKLAVSGGIFLALLALVGTGARGIGERLPVNAGTPSGQQLQAPEDSESFDFMIFADHKGGPVESVEVLADAVEMVNRLDVDFVMTVGDLIQGYNKPEQWRAQMQEFKAVMSGLNMPWYPVPGNHDVYARPQRAGGHTGLYKEHFGPLYYSFEYKWAHFIVLFSDESQSFNEPAKNQKFSTEQLDWLRQDLAASDAGQVFVFLHHPRWTPRYEGCNWPEAHALFVNDGRPTTIYAGHIHMYRDDGLVDNVHYYALATTGGHRTRYRDSASIHHVTFVRVRPDRITTAVLPIGGVYASDFVLGAEVDEMNGLTHGDWLDIHGQPVIGVDAATRSSFTINLANAAGRSARCELAVRANSGWKLEYESVDRMFDAGEKMSVAVHATAPALGADEPHVNVVARLWYPLRSGLIQPIEIQTAVPVELQGVEALAGAVPRENGVLQLDGGSAVRVLLPPAPPAYTLECWVRGAAPEGRVALVAKTQSSSYGIFWSDAGAGATTPIAYVGTTAGYLKLPTTTPWKWDEWTHVAVVFDGQWAAWYVNGQLQASETTDAEPTSNRHPLYIGADPDARSRPTSFFTGAVDEVRLSQVARYVGPFTPARIFERDEETLLLMHCDRMVGGALPDDSGKKHHGWRVGQARVVREDR
ncbi:MAG: LamG-like jellyroll fold domain-containing protein [Planctomycetota bacterium]